MEPDFFNVVIALVSRPHEHLIFTVGEKDRIWEFLQESSYAESLTSFGTTTLGNETVINIIEFLHKNLSDPPYEMDKVRIGWFSRNTAGVHGNSSHSTDVFTLRELREFSIYSTSEDICLAYAFGILEIIFRGMHVCKYKVKIKE